MSDETPIENCDVAVLGGGSAGLAAALSSARLGARTVLLERQSKLGGLGTNANVHSFCGLFHPDGSEPARWLNEGVPREIGEAILKRTGQDGPNLEGRVYVLRHPPSLYAELANELCDREPHLQLRLETESHDVRRIGSEWHFDAVAPGAKVSRIRCRALVDTTGDAEVAQGLGEEFCQRTTSDRLYRPGFIAIWKGLSMPLTDETRLQIAGAIVRGIRENQLPPEAVGATFRNSSNKGEAFVSIDLEAGKSRWNPLDAEQVETVTSEGRSIMNHLWRYMRTSLPLFASVPEPTSPDRLGIRESIRWKGDHVLESKDLVACTRFEDEVALAGWPMEKRETARGPRFVYFSKPEPAGIPARCLRNSTLPGLFFAGRCLSCDHEALASLRVMGTCLATGQAAGRLAADYATGST